LNTGVLTTVNEADYVIVGGGSAGCVLANRLSENRNVRVVLLEAGEETTGVFAAMPVGVMKLLPNPERNWMYRTEPDPSVGGRSIMWHSGRMLGGSSSINGMVYIRGAREDYDEWAAAGCTGWSWDDVLPYFLRSENFEGPDSPWHGKGGPLSVAPSRSYHPLLKAFMDACGEVGLRQLDEYCNGDIDGVFANYVTQAKGRRASTERAFLRPALRRPNLEVVTSAHADRVVFEGGRAVGVLFKRGGQDTLVRVRKEVLISAGSMQSPAILLRSGIGAGSALQALGIDVVADVADVGRNLQEHASYASTRFVNVPTYNTMSATSKLPRHVLEYFLLHKGLLTTSPVLSMANLRSSPELARPDIKISMSPTCMDAATMGPHAQNGMTIYANVSPPNSRGEIRLRSRDALDHPLIDHRLLGDDGDIRILISAVKHVDRIFRAPALARFVTGMNVPPKLPRDDAEWEALIRAGVGIGFHPVGTCRMGADTGAVVDPALKVRGVQGLRVIDASIMPVMPNANTNAPAIMIGEKGADLVKSDLR
jgi:choline dehydrogenase